MESYDSTLYFQDLVHPEAGVDAVAREAKAAVTNGWRAMKLKLGRPGRWFEPNAGVARDIEVDARCAGSGGSRDQNPC